MKKELVIIRGPSGAGKSFLANEMKEKEGALVFANDDLITVGNVYYWDEKKSEAAHYANQKRISQAMKMEEPLLVLDNCNIKLYHVIPYVRLAHYYNYEWKIVSVNTPWANDSTKLEEKNEHGVTRETIDLMLFELKRMPVEAMDMILRFEVPMDPEVSLRKAQEAVEKGLYREVDEHLYDYNDWVRLGGYSPDGGDEAAESISDKLEAWRESAYILKAS